MRFLGRWFRQSPAVGVAVVAVLSATGGIAIASLPGAGATIHACYSKHGGALRILAAGRCGRGEHAVSWSERGPQGLPGVPGQPGQAGPSAVYTKTIGSIDPLGTDPFTVVGSLSVPAGSYIVTGRASFYNSGSNAGVRPACSITAGSDIFHGTELDYEMDELGANSVGSFHIYGGATLIGTYKFTAPGTLLMNCYEVGADPNVSASGVKLTATRVGSLTVVP